MYLMYLLGRRIIAFKIVRTSLARIKIYFTPIEYLDMLKLLINLASQLGNSNLLLKVSVIS